MKGVFACLALGAAATLVRAQGLQLTPLVEEALRSNRDILAAQKRYESARQRPRQAGALPDPTFSVGYQSNGNPLPGAGLGSMSTSNIGVSVTQPVPYPGKRQLRESLAAKEADAEAKQLQIVQLGVVRRLKLAYSHLQHAYAGIEVIGRNREMLNQMLRISEVRYAAGSAAQQDIIKGQIQLTMIEAKTVQLQQERLAAEAEILSALNRGPGELLERPADADPIETNVSVEELFARATLEAPRLQLEQKKIEKSEVALNLARKEIYPDYTITGGYYNMGSLPPMYAARLDFTLPAFAFRKQRPAMTEQYTNLVAARREFEAADQMIHARIRTDYAAAQTAYQLMKLYRDTAIPQAKLALESALTSYQTGAVDYLSVLTNHMAITDFELNYHDQRQAYRDALGRLEEATGMLLVK
ncbi:MAG: TolC family protein [Bryobacteraceae bacterium]